MATCYTVIENAGYEGENERRTAFSTASAAWKWAERNYDKDELETLHVAVREDCDNGESTYEFC